MRRSDARAEVAIEVRVRGRVQGVGFRPTVCRIARELDLGGEVLNDAEGVLVRVGGDAAAVDDFLARLQAEPPPLARVDRIETRAYRGPLSARFRISESQGGAAHTEIAPDAAICAACAAEIANPFERRFRYPFANCTHCGPRLSIIRGIPYDRATTTMAPFPMCADCEGEYRDPADRRFHAEAIACHACGPRATLIRFDGRATSFDQHSTLDGVDAARALLRKGAIVAIKGLGGFHLACDATNVDTVKRLRELKRREAKPFALMAADVDIIRLFCTVSAEEERLLGGPAAPIVLLRADGPARLPSEIAPGLETLGFMLPTTPLHALLLRRFDRPAVMTSGNVADEPQSTDNDEAREKLSGIATYALVHDREIANRVDDSLVRVMAGAPRVLRRARGYAPAPIALPDGFEAAPEVLAMGGELKATFCLVKDGQAILSQHQGDLENAETFDDYRRAHTLYRDLFDHAPVALVIDLHPEYLSTKLAREEAHGRQSALPSVIARSPCDEAIQGSRPVAPGLLRSARNDGFHAAPPSVIARSPRDEAIQAPRPVAPGLLRCARNDGAGLIEVQHHHAHVAACLAENGRPLEAPPVLGVVLDGLGWGDDGTIWGGEFLLADYRSYRRLGCFKPVAMLGGARAAREPWRNLYAHLMAEMGWAEFAMNFAELELFADLAARPRATLDAMARNGVNAPKASSCGRLFDAVAAALNLCRERQAYEGEAGARLEAIVDPGAMRDDREDSAYPLSIPNLRESGLPYIEPLAMWRAILGDLILRTPAPIMAARFHKGLANIIAAMARKLAGRDDGEAPRFDAIALSGGCFQNRVLFEQVVRLLQHDGFRVLTHSRVPANDGGLALGQAAIGAARLIDPTVIASGAKQSRGDSTRPLDCFVARAPRNDE